jgi:hypothetical protein
VFKVWDDNVIESWMFHQDTVAILDFLKEAQQQDIIAINGIASRVGRPSFFYICRPGRSDILDLASRK